MDPSASLVIPADASPEVIVDILTKFNEAHKETRDYSAFPGEDRKAFVKRVSELAINEEHDEQLRTTALLSLRYILRDKAGPSELVALDVVFHILRIAGLIAPDTPLPDDNALKALEDASPYRYPSLDDESGIEDEEEDKRKAEDLAAAKETADKLPLLDTQVEALGEPWETKTSPILQAEAAKCIINIITRNQQSEAIVGAFNVLPVLLLRLEKNAYPKEARFAYMRLLLRMTFERVLKLRIYKSRVLNILAASLERSMEDIDDTIYSSDIEEILKVIFSVSIPLGPLEGPTPPNDDQYQAFKQMIVCFQKLLFLPKEPKYRRLKAATVSALINVPAKCTELFEQQERTLDALIEVLFFQLETACQDESRAAECLTPVLLNLTAIAKAIPRARTILKHAVFPPEVLENTDTKATIQAHEVLEKGDSAASKLMDFMTSFNMAVKHYVNNFFYIILDEDANELVRLIGFGRAAGLLATLKLFGMDKLAEAQMGKGGGGGGPSGASGSQS
uniref:Uncharacterized protein n=1 Tax=Paramoeba aestuarina TaxID=180227 RepID=A0A7S4NUK7_9EUKA|mmetsp:Transcript_28902/g.44707  ORF Transcript_28902/g.44707 Transcript_28902/m.44707 type:complete len:508 (+) Transcript_28902:116-1639(+)|eukprot:CAMPEP_0201526964 /NCGR_PEP_ID=MMETSP0161_2-20130828/33530_1 /ASSEMBLY_ACC=CAM_ASM_000251 /TAXON_ID=180227 /ORGANISM="Neoparamoeba aestuarina, Strain SoJaBio B1-5/56/2" /LENGTH=507 /DNA_ID=CAMNT_0047927571 /DNA_START=21 /DNA_END=1544 /DNA_ORIENTATION=-